MRIGIMSFAHLHAVTYVHHLGGMPDIELIGVADDEPARGQHYAGQYNLRYFDTYEALLAEKPDAVLICAENAYHHRLTVMAAEAGAHVLCEKPLMTSIDDGKAMLAACEKAGVQLMTAFPMRFNAPTIEGKKVVDSGSLGTIYGCSTTNQGKMPRDVSWFTNKKLAGGGALTDHTVHVADLLRWYLGCEVVEVFAESNAILNSDFKPEVETGGIVMLKFENGTFATIDCSWSRPSFYPAWGGVTMELVGSTGVISINAFKQTIAVHSHQSDLPSWPFWGSDADKGMVHEFLSAVRENRQPAVTGYDGYRAAEIALAAHRSVETKQPVSLPLEGS